MKEITRRTVEWAIIGSCSTNNILYSITVHAKGIVALGVYDIYRRKGDFTDKYHVVFVVVENSLGVFVKNITPLNPEQNIFYKIESWDCEMSEESSLVVSVQGVEFDSNDKEKNFSINTTMNLYNDMIHRN